MGGASQKTRLLQSLSCVAAHARPASLGGLLSSTAASRPALLPQRVPSSSLSTCNVASRLLPVSAFQPALPSPSRTMLPLLEGLTGNAAAAAASRAFPAGGTSLTAIARCMSTGSSTHTHSPWQIFAATCRAAYVLLKAVLGVVFSMVLFFVSVEAFGPFLCGALCLVPAMARIRRFGNLTSRWTFPDNFYATCLAYAGVSAVVITEIEKVPYTLRLHKIKSMAPKTGGQYVPARPLEDFFAEASSIVGWRNQLLPADHPDVVRVRRVLQRLAAAAAGRGGGQYDHMRADMPWAVAVVAPVVGASEEQLKQRREDWMAGRDDSQKFDTPAHEVGLAYDYPICVIPRGEDKMHEVLLNQRTLQLAGEDESLLAAALAHKLAVKLARHEVEDRKFHVLGHLGVMLEDEDPEVPVWHRRTHEADFIAVHLLSEAGYDPAGMVRWLERIQEQEQRGKEQREQDQRERKQHKSSPSEKETGQQKSADDPVALNRQQRDATYASWPLSDDLFLAPVKERLRRVQQQLRRMDEAGQLKQQRAQHTVNS
ncbi:hypothetical protein Agub_g4314 [Astrephomene gubernaculifera]|uniref:Uncharacterized protein n=1 Tax=Astrephomene gubernaculifera TaxID=47775 RepID=A0AAD3DMD6_9CHLO|nr:hypothetical protein Agub_g4314 [Astrephomene gubernaculifera]